MSDDYTRIPRGGCYLQDICPKYTSGDNKPANHYVRLTVICFGCLKLDCELYIQMMSFFGETIACDPVKIRRIRKGVRL